MQNEQFFLQSRFFESVYSHVKTVGISATWPLFVAVCAIELR